MLGGACMCGLRACVVISRPALSGAVRSKALQRSVTLT
jgi:hypothetical protein